MGLRAYPAARSSLGLSKRRRRDASDAGEELEPRVAEAGFGDRRGRVWAALRSITEFELLDIDLSLPRSHLEDPRARTQDPRHVCAHCPNGADSCRHGTQVPGRRPMSNGLRLICPKPDCSSRPPRTCPSHAIAAASTTAPEFEATTLKASIRILAGLQLSGSKGRGDIPPTADAPPCRRQSALPGALRILQARRLHADRMSDRECAVSTLHRIQACQIKSPHPS